MFAAMQLDSTLYIIASKITLGRASHGLNLTEPNLRVVNVPIQFVGECMHCLCLVTIFSVVYLRLVIGQ